MKILMGTKNPGKIEGAKLAFEKYFDNVDIEGIDINIMMKSNLFHPLDQNLLKPYSLILVIISITK